MTRVVAYIDGFNLYHGVRDKFGRSQLWINLERLVQSLLRPGQHLVGVEYFTARVRNDMASVHRQATYLTALATCCPRLTVTEGRFQERTVWCRLCRSSWVTYDEKETDVNIASALLRDSYGDRIDVALLVTADADLAPAIETARLDAGKRVIVAFPPRRRSGRLQSSADGAMTIGDAKIRASQLPARIQLPTGVTIERPPYWR